jgi:cytochrome c oxidase subunit 2
VYNANCAACHQANGEGIPGNFPAIKGSAVALGPLDDHIQIVVKGKGAMMPGFADSLSKLDIAAVVTYQRNGFGNEKGDMLQPSQVP